MPRFKPPQGISPRFGALLIAAFAIPRIALLCLSFGDPFDIKSYALIEWVGHTGNALYSSPVLVGRYPYLPAWALLVQGLGYLGRSLGGTPWILLKLPGILAELGIVWLLLDWRDAGGAWIAPGRRRAAALAYALSPIAWMVTAGHGQFDAVVLFFILAAARVWGKPGLSMGLRAGLWMGIAICFKQWPVFLLPVFFRNAGDRRAGLGFIGTALMVPLLLLLPYLAQEGFAPVWGHLAYAGVPNVSLGEALKPLFNLLAGRKDQVLQAWERGSLMLLLLLWAAAWRGRRRELGEALALMVLGFLVLAPNLEAQYLLWPLPFLALLDPAVAWRYTAVAGSLLLFFYAEFDPKALDMAWSGSLVHLGTGLMLFWALLNCGFWIYTVVEWARLMRGKQGGPRLS